MMYDYAYFQPKSRHLPFLYIATWLSQMSIGINSIAVPIYAYKMGASTSLIGLIGASYGLVYSLSPAIFGRLSDRLSRITLISLSMALYATTSALYFLANNPANLVHIKIVESLALAMFWPSVESLIADSVQRQHVQKSLSRFNISWASSMIFSPFLAGFVISAIGLREPFLISTTISILLCALAPVYLVKVPTSKREKLMVALRSKERNISLLALVSTFMFSFTVGILFSLFPATATHSGIQAYQIGLLFLIFGLTRTVTFWQSKKFETKEIRSLIFSSIILASSAMMIALGTSYMLLIVSFAIAGIGAGMAYSTSLSIMLNKRTLSRGAAAGQFESVLGLGFFIGPLLGGLLSETIFAMPYILATFTSLIIFVIQLVLASTLNTRSKSL